MLEDLRGLVLVETRNGRSETRNGGLANHAVEDTAGLLERDVILPCIISVCRRPRSISLSHLDCPDQATVKNLSFLSLSDHLRKQSPEAALVKRTTYVTKPETDTISTTDEPQTRETAYSFLKDCRTLHVDRRIRSTAVHVVSQDAFLRQTRRQ